MRRAIVVLGSLRSTVGIAFVGVVLSWNSAVAQSGWLSGTSIVQHSFYSGSAGQFSSPTGEFETSLMYRHMLGKRAGLWLGWNYGARSFRREETYLGGTQELEFEYTEHSLFVGLSIEAARSEKSHVNINLGCGRYIASVARWTLLSTSAVPNAVVSRDFQAPMRTGFKLGFRYAHRLSGRLWFTGGPCFVLIAPPREDYVSGSDATGKYISVGELRKVLALELGLELGPLFNRTAREQ